MNQPSSSNPIPTWSSLGLSPEMLQAIERAGFKEPTPVQAKAIPLALEGKDVLASAQTGTGKTLGFAAPLIEKFASRKGTYAIVLCPTREIAQQTYQVFKTFGEPRGLQTAVLIGGVSMKLDEQAIALYPQVIVATPGRLCDHLEKGHIWLDYIEAVVLDEADRMLDMGFSTQLGLIMRDIPQSAQKLLFSATISPEIDQIARKFMHDPVRVTIGKPVRTTSTVEQRFMYVHEDDKFHVLQDLLQDVPGTTIVFARSKITAERLWDRLYKTRRFPVTCIHSNMEQKYREQALEDFKSGKYSIMIATDVAGRGIHVDNVAHVINYELPMEMEEYIHRIGRTGRAQSTGLATTFISDRDRRNLGELERVVGRRVDVEGLPTFRRGR